MKIDDYFERKEPLFDRIKHAIVWKCKRLKSRIKHLYLWAKIGWQYENWDFHYTLEVLTLTLKLQRDGMVNSGIKFVGQPKQERLIGECIEILRRRSEEGYEFRRAALEAAEVQWKLMYPEGVSLERFVRPETPEQKKIAEAWVKNRKAADKLEEIEFKRLMTIMSKHLQRWWV